MKCYNILQYGEPLNARVFLKMKFEVEIIVKMCVFASNLYTRKGSYMQSINSNINNIFQMMHHQAFRLVTKR